LRSDERLVGGLDLAQLRVATVELFGASSVSVNSRVRQLNLNLFMLREESSNGIEHD
jgi:hypothetical protein